MTRWGILTTYKIVGPILLIFIVLEQLGSWGIINLDERSPLGSVLYTPRAVLTMAIGLSIPIIILLGLVILFRFWGDWPVVLPALLAALAFTILMATAFAEFPERIDDLLSMFGMGIAGMAVLAAIWAGWFARAPQPL